MGMATACLGGGGPSASKGEELIPLQWWSEEVRAAHMGMILRSH